MQLAGVRGMGRGRTANGSDGRCVHGTRSRRGHAGIDVEGESRGLLTVLTVEEMWRVGGRDGQEASHWGGGEEVLCYGRARGLNRACFFGPTWRLHFLHEGGEVGEQERFIHHY